MVINFILLLFIFIFITLKTWDLDLNKANSGFNVLQYFVVVFFYS